MARESLFLFQLARESLFLLVVWPLGFPFFGAIETNLVLTQVVKVDLVVRPITSCTTLFLIELAAAEIDSLAGSIPDKLQRFIISHSLNVRLITEGLSLRLTARAVVIFLSWDKFRFEWLPLDWHWELAWVQLGTTPHPGCHRDLQPLQSAHFGFGGREKSSLQGSAAASCHNTSCTLAYVEHFYFS